MRLSDLTPEDCATMARALACAASGRVLEHDEEFDTLFGMAPSEVSAVSQRFTALDELDQTSWMAANNSMVWLASYPHHRDSILSEFGLTRDDLVAAHLRIREAFKLQSNNFLDLIE
jgi:hypothetical protein